MNYLHILINKHFSKYITEGIRIGFPIGFNRQTNTCKSALQNMVSASDNPQVVNDYLRPEIENHRVVQVPSRELRVSARPRFDYSIL